MKKKDIHGKMKLLIVTQAVDSDDQALGFFLGWIKEFANNCENVSVICLIKGKYDLPPNVTVYSLGKERGQSRLKYLKNFFKFIFALKNDYDSVFVHMNYIYALLGGLFWKIWNKKVGMWYVHRQKSFGLWLSQIWVDIIFTSSPESFGYKSKKVVYVGHGIDNTQFVCTSGRTGGRTTIVSVGRITPIKSLETLILAAELLHPKISNLFVEFIGKPVTRSDENYYDLLQKMIKDKMLEGVVSFKGSVPSLEISKVYCHADISVNMAPTGGWDKAVIESIMAQCPAFASNLGLKPVFGQYGDIFLFKQGNALDLAQKIEAFLTHSDRAKVMDELSRDVCRKYDLKNLIKSITNTLQGK